MKIKMLRCGVCKFWYHLAIYRMHADGAARMVHCPVCGSYPVYFRHWFPTHFNVEGKQVVRAQHAGILSTITR
jgi:hypothetical protein